MLTFIQALINLGFDPREFFRLLGIKRQKQEPPKSEGQYLVEYALLIVLVAIAAILVYMLRLPISMGLDHGHRVLILISKGTTT